MWRKKRLSTSLGLKALVQEIIADLSDDVTEDELRQGWDSALKSRWRDWFRNLDCIIADGNDIPAGWGIARAMDFDGVGRTPISAKASRIGKLLDQGIRY